MSHHLYDDPTRAKIFETTTQQYLYIVHVLQRSTLSVKIRQVCHSSIAPYWFDELYKFSENIILETRHGINTRKMRRMEPGDGANYTFFMVDVNHSSIL